MRWSRQARSEQIADGDTFGAYRIEALLGEGGMGQVFRATRESDGAVVALKVVKSSIAGDEQHMRRFQREARALAAVHHRHVVSVLDAGEADGRRYIAMAYIDGMSLDRRIQEAGALPIPETVRVACHVAAGLDALHSAGLVHRDIKPSNVMLDEEGVARLTDFGLAKGRDYSAVTAPGQVLGTLDYLAPEVIRGDEPDARADIYALGCLVYECIAGLPPFGHKSAFEVGMGHLDETPPDPCAQRADAPAHLTEAVLHALAKEPAQRPPTATAYARMLTVAAHAGGR